MTAKAEAELPGLPPRNAEEAAAAKAAAAPGSQEVPRAGRGPLRISGTAPPPESPREPLFYITGDDGGETEYTIPVRAPEYIWANALVLSATRGGGPAEAYMMQEMLGLQGFAALLGCKALTKADYRQLVTVVRDKVMGPEEADPNP